MEKQNRERERGRKIFTMSILDFKCIYTRALLALRDLLVYFGQILGEEFWSLPEKARQLVYTGLEDYSILDSNSVGIVATGTHFANTCERTAWIWMDAFIRAKLTYYLY